MVIRRRLVALIGGIVLAFGFAVHTFAFQHNDDFKWLSNDGNGGIVFHQDSRGNGIPDFSSAGSELLGEVSPSSFKVEVLPSGSSLDDAARIQSAIDKVSSNSPDGSGNRGIVSLGAGTFTVSESLHIRHSGVQIRGAGPTQTIVRAVGAAKPLLVLQGRGQWRRITPMVSISSYVGVGSKSLTVEDSSLFSIGQSVIVQRPMSINWIRSVGMDQIPSRSSGTVRQWQPSPGLLFDRRITSISGQIITVDSSITNSIELDDGGTVWGYSFKGRISNVHISNLSAVADYSGRQPDIDRHAIFASFSAIEDSSIQNVIVSRFTTSLNFLKTSNRITASDFEIEAFENSRDRGAQPAAISVDGQNILVKNCQLRGRNYIALATQSVAPGPNVMLNCSARGRSVRVEAHQRWATGLLLDNVAVDGVIHIGNRGNSGTGHGWSGANSVVWNSKSDSYLIESPPTAFNWAFGLHGQRLHRNYNLGVIVSPNRDVSPQSLYLYQVGQRASGKGSR